MKLKDCFELLIGRRGDALVVTSAGNASEMWWSLTGDSESTFYLEASMSLSSMFAAGIARGLPDARVWAFSGDGAFAMNPGMLMVERHMALANMTHFLVSNRVYGATWNAPVPNRADNDYAAMARAFGGYGERVTAPEDIIPAIKRGIEQTENGIPALLEFITSKEVDISIF